MVIIQCATNIKYAKTIPAVLKIMCPGWIATFKIGTLFLSNRLRFSLLFLQIPLLGLYVCYVFSPLMFFCFVFFSLRKKDGKAECLEKTLLPPLTLQSALCPHSIFSSPVSSFSEEVMCSANPVCWLPPYSGGYANTSKPEILDLFTAQDNTLCISIWSARAEKGEWTTFFFFFFFWLEALGRLEM